MSNITAVPRVETCCNPGYLVNHTPAGKYVIINGIECYSIGSSDKFVILNTDVFGFKFINLQAVADALYEEAKLNVLIPDLFPAGPVSHDADWSKLDFRGWLEKNSVETAIKRSNSVIEAITAANGTKSGFSVSVIGYCYGVRVCESQLIHFSQVKNSVWAHPSFVSTAEANKIPAGKNILINCAENDSSFTPELRAKYSEILLKNEVKLVTKDYPGTDHGFCSRPKDGGEHAMKMRKLAQDETVNFLKTHA